MAGIGPGLDREPIASIHNIGRVTAGRNQIRWSETYRVAVSSMGTEHLFTSRQTGHRFQTTITDYQAAGLEGKAVVREADRRMTGEGRRRRQANYRD